MSARDEPAQMPFPGRDAAGQVCEPPPECPDPPPGKAARLERASQLAAEPVQHREVVQRKGIAVIDPERCLEAFHSGINFAAGKQPFTLRPFACFN